MLKTLLVSAALLLPVTAFAQMAAPAPGALPKCSAKVQDSCDQSMTTEKNAIDHYPADTRDAGNFKTGKGGMAMSHSMARPMAKKHMMKKKVAPMAATTSEPMAADPVK